MARGTNPFSAREIFASVPVAPSLTFHVFVAVHEPTLVCLCMRMAQAAPAPLKAGTPSVFNAGWAAPDPSWGSLTPEQVRLS